MSELLPILETLITDVEAGRPCALCTVVGKKGSAPQTPGASLVLRSDFSTLGTLGGGCVEAEACQRARENLSANQSSVTDFKLDNDYGWDDGLICGGSMRIAVMPFTQEPELEPLRNAIAAAKKGEMARLPIEAEHEGKRLGWNVMLEAAPRVVIAGGGHVGRALANLMLDLDFRITALDDRAECLTPARFPDPIERIARDIPAEFERMELGAADYAVIVTRGHRHDRDALAAIVNRDLRYIGVIGSKRKMALIFDDLRATGVSEERLARVHTPIGLPIGGVLVPEIAVSIAAELIQERRRTTPKLVEGPFALD